MGLEFGIDLESLMRVQSRCRLGLQSTEDLTEAGWLQGGSLPWLLARGLLSWLNGHYIDSLQHGDWLPPEKIIWERARLMPQSIYWPSFGSDIPTLLLWSVGHTDLPWQSVGGDYTRAWILGVGSEAILEAQRPTWTGTSVLGLSCWWLSKSLISMWKPLFHNNMWWVVCLCGLDKGY